MDQATDKLMVRLIRKTVFILDNSLEEYVDVQETEYMWMENVSNVVILHPQPALVLGNWLKDNVYVQIIWYLFQETNVYQIRILTPQILANLIKYALTLELKLSMDFVFVQIMEIITKDFVIQTEEGTNISRYILFTTLIRLLL